MQKEVIIYPGDYLIAKHVVFQVELNGKLPLLYPFPLYLPEGLRTESILEPGYSATRGWFLKNYPALLVWGQAAWELYLDYYTISGSGLVVLKQHFLYEEKIWRLIFFLYGQENRTGLPGLFNWRGELSIDNDKTSGIHRYLCQIYWIWWLFLYKWPINLHNKVDTWSLDLRSYFTSRDYFESDKNW